MQYHGYFWLPEDPTTKYWGSVDTLDLMLKIQVERDSVEALNSVNQIAYVFGQVTDSHGRSHVVVLEGVLATGASVLMTNDLADYPILSFNRVYKVKSRSMRGLEIAEKWPFKFFKMVITFDGANKFFRITPKKTDVVGWLTDGSTPSGRLESITYKEITIGLEETIRCAEDLQKIEYSVEAELFIELGIASDITIFEPIWEWLRYLLCLSLQRGIQPRIKAVSIDEHTVEVIANWKHPTIKVGQPLIKGEQVIALLPRWYELLENEILSEVVTKYVETKFFDPGFIENRFTRYVSNIRPLYKYLRQYCEWDLPKSSRELQTLCEHSPAHAVFEVFPVDYQNVFNSRNYLEHPESAPNRLRKHEIFKKSGNFLYSLFQLEALHEVIFLSLLDIQDFSEVTQGLSRWHDTLVTS